MTMLYFECQGKLLARVKGDTPPPLSAKVRVNKQMYYVNTISYDVDWDAEGSQHNMAIRVHLIPY